MARQFSGILAGISGAEPERHRNRTFESAIWSIAIVNQNTPQGNIFRVSWG